MVKIRVGGGDLRHGPHNSRFPAKTVALYGQLREKLISDSAQSKVQPQSKVSLDGRAARSRKAH